MSMSASFLKTGIISWFSLFTARNTRSYRGLSVDRWDRLTRRPPAISIPPGS